MYGIFVYLEYLTVIKLVLRENLCDKKRSSIMIHQNGETKENECVFCNTYFIWKGSLETTKKLLKKTKDSALQDHNIILYFPLVLFLYIC